MAPWATASEVKAAISFPETGAPVSDTDIETFVVQAQEEVNLIMHTEFYNSGDTVPSVTETIDGSGKTEMFTSRQPLKELTALEVDGITVTPANCFVYTDGSSKISLAKSGAEATLFTQKQQAVTLTYSYGITPVPQIIKRLCILLAGMRTLTAQIAGTYDDFTSISLPGGLSGSKGEPYMNVQSALNYMQGEARGIIYGSQSTGQVSGDFRTNPSYPPFALFE